MVPNGWEVKSPSKLFKLFSGFAFKSSDAKESGAKWLKIANVGIGEIKWDADSFLPEHFLLEHKKYLLTKGDIVVALTRPTLGNKLKVARLTKDSDTSLLNQRVAKIVCKDNVDSEFTFQVLRSDQFAFRINVGLLGTDPPNLSVKVLEDFTIPVPPLPEQRKIAQILSTWDKAIATTEKLIDASKQQKKALMQQLLTGKKRLIDPETGKAFEGEWEEVRLSALSIKGKGNFTDGDWIESPYIADSGCRLIQTGNIGVGCFKNKAKKYISEASFVKLKCKEVKVNDLLICRLAEPAGRACVVPDIGERKMLTSVDVTIMRVDKTKSSPEYLSYFFSLDHTLYTVTTLCGGSTRSRISRTNLGRMKIFLPALNEQQKIAAVLSAADKEIELLEAKLAHFMQEKKALMQQLLTGKRRVKVAETEAA
ncbi:restriction endonuclease subunit S [Photobacterium sp. CCB-ST2H9]|uniref:restriction endonuclease subunit S n=1 Tax=Photobacterium sp. CCB-ST2H9 TaxID=2912855 RepID=UPI0020050573|nr:restriction endonuclease subunit S [Photobacterium sp. CCB-ST2H9]UTM57394.1 restriction endonuclease subunit S [Photobacterium sp. CCB-ST2H9]